MVISFAFLSNEPLTSFAFLGDKPLTSFDGSGNEPVVELPLGVRLHPHPGSGLGYHQSSRAMVISLGNKPLTFFDGSGNEP